MLKNLWNDECGMVLTAELVLVLTIAVLGMIVGLSHVAMALNTELNDIAQAIGALDQSYSFSGYVCCKKNSTNTADSSGSRFNDTSDDCDCSSSCDVISVPGTAKSGG